MVLRGQGRIVSNAEAIPAAVHLGARSLGEEARETVTLRPRTEEGFTLERVETRGPGLRLAAPARQEGASYYIDLAQKVLKQGDQTTWLRLHVRFDSGRRGRVDVPVRYYGLQELVHSGIAP